MTHTAVTSRERMTGEERRQHLIRAAIKLFSEKGLRGTTTRELAEAGGVSEALLYQHFETKDEFYDAIIDHKMREAHPEGREEWFKAAESKDDRVVLVAVGKDILHQYEKDPAYIRLLVYSALEGHDLSSKFFERQVRPYYEFLAQYFKTRMADGAFRKTHPVVAARAWLGMINHLGLMRTLFDDSILRLSSARILDQFVEVFLKGMTVR